MPNAPARIFHYTTIDTLALILKSKKLRFNRLDRVDDVREAQSHSGVEFGKCFFVSCWTAEAQESIPQWHMYTDRMSGVRIELPAYPFEEKRQEPLPAWTGIEKSGVLYAPLSMTEMFGPTYMVLPSCMDRKQFAGPVEYVDDVEERYASAVTRKTQADGTIISTIKNPADLVRLKSNDWRFQSEYRFHLFVLPSIPLPPEGPGSPAFYNALPAHMGNSLFSGVDPGINHIDLDIRASALSELVVTTGPLCSPGGKLCVEALVKQHARLGRVQASILEGAVRAK